MSAKFSEFLTLSPVVTYIIHASSFLLSAFQGPPSPQNTADVIYGSPLVCLLLFESDASSFRPLIPSLIHCTVPLAALNMTLITVRYVGRWIHWAFLLSQNNPFLHSVKSLIFQCHGIILIYFISSVRHHIEIAKQVSVIKRSTAL